MDRKRVTRRDEMKEKSLFSRLAVVCFVVLCGYLSAGCEGYTGPGWDLGTELLDPDNLYAWIQNPDPTNIFIIDVRPSAAYNAGHIPSAYSFPSSEIASRLGEPPLDNSDNYFIVYCETGGRAQMVITNDLIPNGRVKVMNWGGVTRWTNAGYSLVQP
jgi:rhodanese-related sulfurtransferase